MQLSDRMTGLRAPARGPDKPHRASSDSVLQGRAARQATTGIASRLSLWQARIARLRGIADYRGVADSDLQREISTLAGLIREEQQKFHATVATLPDSVAAHGRIADMQRALHRASQALASMGASEGA